MSVLFFAVDLHLPILAKGAMIASRPLFLQHRIPDTISHLAQEPHRKEVAEPFQNQY